MADNTMPHSDLHSDLHSDTEDVPGPASKAKKRYTTGFPSQILPGEPEDTGSDPEWPDVGTAEHKDFYRDSVKRYEENGQVVPGFMPAESPYRRDYENYKALDRVASGLNKDIRAHNKLRNEAQAQHRAMNPWDARDWQTKSARLRKEAKEAWEK